MHKLQIGGYKFFARFAERQQRAHKVEQRFFVLFLRLHVYLFVIYDGQERLVGRRKSRVLFHAPLHGRARPRAVKPALDGRHVFYVLHAYFVAVVYKRHARQCEQRRVYQLELLVRIERREPRRVVVTAYDGDITVRVLYGVVPFRKAFGKSRSVASALRVEITLFAAFLGAHQKIVRIAVVIEHKVGVESRAHCLRIRPLGHEHRVGIVLVEHLAYITPYLARSGLVAAVAVVLDERISHIHAEPVDAAIEPESNHLFEPLARFERRFGLVRRLPGRIVHAVEAVVERGLRRKEVYYIIAHVVTAVHERRIVHRVEP